MNRDQLRRIAHVVLDLDGTIYRGRSLFSCTQPFLALLRELRIGYTFLTNNSSKSAAEYLLKLQALGIGVEPEQIYTSGQATLAFLKERKPGLSKLFVLGTPSLQEEFRAQGFAVDDTAVVAQPPTAVLTGEGACATTKAEPEGVVVGFDTTLTHRRLCQAAYWIARGKVYLATHPDRVCPTDEPTVWVDCGSICAALQLATGRLPDAVLGKPNPAMLRPILERHNLQPCQIAAVGDRLDTDIELAHQSGAWGVLVLTGETTPEAAARQQPPPALTVASLREFGQLLSAAHQPP